MVARHNHLRDIFANFCRLSHLSVRVEVGNGLARDHVNSRPADVLVQGWDRGKPAAFDVTEQQQHMIKTSLLLKYQQDWTDPLYAYHPTSSWRKTSPCTMISKTQT